MTEKERDTLTGKVEAVCIILSDIQSEIYRLRTSSYIILKKLEGAQQSMRDLLRATGYEEVDNGPDSEETSRQPDAEASEG